MEFASPKLGELLHRKLGHGRGKGNDRKGNENLVGMQAGVVAAKMVDL
jgi:hypothetical protein